MAIGIEKKDSALTQWTVPLASYDDETWCYNTWIVNHLRQLADKIEAESPKIYGLGIISNSQYKTPMLIIDILG